MTFKITMTKLLTCEDGAIAQVKPIPQCTISVSLTRLYVQPCPAKLSPQIMSIKMTSRKIMASIQTRHISTCGHPLDSIYDKCGLKCDLCRRFRKPFTGGENCHKIVCLIKGTKVSAHSKSVFCAVKPLNSDSLMLLGWSCRSAQCYRVSCSTANQERFETWDMTWLEDVSV